MKLRELVGLQFDTGDDETDERGTYAAVTFSKRTQDAIKQYQEDNQIPNRVPRDKLHCTLLYSRKHLPNYQAAGDYQQPMEGHVKQLESWPTRPDENGQTSNCLVLRFICDELYDRHKKLMDEHQATYDFPEYLPHITFSYDMSDTDVESLPPYEGPIEIVHEYQEDLSDTLEKNAKGE